MNNIVYFAYGSNMSQRRLRARVSSATLVGMAILQGHVLAFHKIGNKDGSGKCDIVKSKNGVVYGVLFSISSAELPILDEHEGNNRGYERRVIQVQDDSGLHIEALTYIATNIDPDLRPYTWYKRHVLEGAREMKFPPEYLLQIEAIEAIEDPDKERERIELAIYV